MILKLCVHVDSSKRPSVGVVLKLFRKVMLLTGGDIRKDTAFMKSILEQVKDIDGLTRDYSRGTNNSSGYTGDLSTYTSSVSANSFTGNAPLFDVNMNCGDDIFSGCEGCGNAMTSCCCGSCESGGIACVDTCRVCLHGIDSGINASCSACLNGCVDCGRSTCGCVGALGRGCFSCAEGTANGVTSCCSTCFDGCARCSGRVGTECSSCVSEMSVGGYSCLGVVGLVVAWLFGTSCGAVSTPLCPSCGAIGACCGNCGSACSSCAS